MNQINMPGCAYLKRLSQVQIGLSMGKHGLKIQSRLGTLRSRAGLSWFGVDSKAFSIQKDDKLVDIIYWHLAMIYKLFILLIPSTVDVDYDQCG